MDVLPETDTSLPPTPSAPPLRGIGPNITRPRRHRPPITHCLNCGALVAGRYCPDCGQETHDQSVALGTLASELASEALSLDSKVARTVLPLLFHPGFLTNEFNRGRRVRYLSPLKMYLVISALFFFVLAQQSAVKRLNLLQVPAAQTAGKAQQAALQSARAEINTEIAHAQTPEDRAALRKAQAVLTAKLAPLSPAPKPPKTAQGLHVAIGPDNINADTLPKTVAAYDAHPASLPPHLRDTGRKRLITRQLIKTQQNKRGLVQGFLDNLPRMMFVLLPAFALLLRVTYWRTKRLYVAHLIFALHTHAFVFLILTGVLLLPDAVRNPAEGGAFLLMTVYLFAALKTVYGQNWGRTLLAFGWLGFNYLFLLTFAFLLTLGVAFLLA